MSLHRFFLDSQVLSAEVDDVFRLAFDVQDLKHAKVIRLQRSEHIAVIDADGDYFECEIRDIAPDGIFVSISQHLDPPKDAFELVLYQGLAKGERFEFVLKHATELGVSRIVPLLSERCVVKLDQRKIPSKMSRWRSIVRNAAKQAGLVVIPSVSDPCHIDDALLDLKGFDLVLICWEEAREALRMRDAIVGSSLKEGSRVAIIVGPEGGLCDSEVSSLLHCNTKAKLSSLGPTILRTETAGIVSCALALDELRWELKA